MLYSIIFTLIALDANAKTCGELSKRNITTYVPSDFNINFIEGTTLKPVFEVSYPVWGSISQAFWIWSSQSFPSRENATIVFTQTFTVPGKIISGKIEFLVDNYVTDIKFNGLNANYPSNAAFTYLSTSILDTLLVKGLNYFNITVLNIGKNNPAGLCFLITVVSEVLV